MSNTNDPINSKVVIITGASSGIGLRSRGTGSSFACLASSMETRPSSTMSSRCNNSTISISDIPRYFTSV